MEELAGTQRIVAYDRSESAPLLGDNIVLIPTPTNSPNDPLNWSPWRKYWHATLCLFVTAFTAAIANDAGSAGDGILAELDISYDVQNTGAGVLFLSIGIFAYIASPMPRLYGRRIQYLICLLSALGGSIWLARIRTRGDVIWNQMFVGASESCAEALVQLSLSELYFQHQRGAVMGIYILATSIGTFLGPLIAGYIAIDNWRWIGWWGAIISGGTLVVFYFGLEETAFNRESYLSRHSQRTQDDEVMTKVDSPSQKGDTGANIEKHKTYMQQIAPITPADNLRGFGFKQYLWQLWHNLQVFGFPAVWFAGLAWGAQDAWLTFYLTVQQDNWYGPPWNYSTAAVSIMNVPTLIGACIGCVYGGWFSDFFVRWVATRKGRGGLSEAEDRLWLLFPSMIISPAGLMLFGIASDRGWSWPVPYVSLGMIGFGWGCAGDLSLAYLIDAYPDMVLESMVGVCVVNNVLLASVFTFCASIWIDAAGLTSTFVTIGVLSFVFHATTIPMIYWGKACRRWTAPRYKRFVERLDS